MGDRTSDGRLTLAVVAAALATVALWGPSPIATKLAAADLSPLAATAWRTTLAGAIALPLALVGRVAPPRAAGALGLLALSSACGFLLFPALFFAGMARTSGLHGVLVLALLPLLTGAIAFAWNGGRPGARWLIGAALALAGAAALGLSRDAGGTGATLLGDAIVLGGSVICALGYVAGARLTGGGYSAWGATLWGLIGAAVVVAPVAALSLEGFLAAGAAAKAGVLYLAVGASIVGYALWYFALGRGGAARVGLFQFLQPATGALAAAAVLGEPITAATLGSAAVILLGVWIATRRPTSRAAQGAGVEPAATASR